MSFERIKTIFKKLTDIDEDTLFYIMMTIIVVGGILLFFFFAYGAAEATFPLQDME